MKTNTLLSRGFRCAAIVGLLLGAMTPGCSDSDDGGELLVPASIDQEVTEAGPNPASIMAQVSNRGSCPLDVTTTASTTDGKAWLSVGPANLTVAPDAAGTITLSFEVVTTALTPGNYVGTVVLAGTCATNGQPARGSPRAIAVILRVTPIGAAIAVDTTSVGVDVNPVVDQWRPMADNPTYQGRNLHTAVWTGREMWVFGGESSTGSIVGLGGKYDPLTDQWSNMPNGGTPGKRVGHTAVWTGTEMIVWGGRDTAGNPLGDGAAYDPAANQWSPVATAGAPIPRAGHVATWETDRMLAVTGDTATGVTDTGKAYR